MKLKQEELYEDNLYNSKWKGEVVDIADPLFLSRIKVKVFGKYDELETSDIPWASASNIIAGSNKTGGGSFSLPKLNSIVEVTFDNGNVYSPRWSFINYMSDELKTKIGNSTDYKTAHATFFDTADKFYVYRTLTDGYMIELNGSIINVRKDNSIYINCDTGKKLKVHINKDYISLGSEDKSAEPGVLGDHNQEALNKLNDTIDKLADTMINYLDQLSQVALSNPYTQLLSPVFKQYAVQIRTDVKTLIPKNHDFFPKTKSTKITLD